MATAEDFGDYLLRTGKVTEEEYKVKQEEAKGILNDKIELILLMIILFLLLCLHITQLLL